MKKSLDEKYNYLYNLFLDLWDKEIYFNALSYISNIYNSLDNLPKQKKYFWFEKINNIKLSDEIIKFLNIEIESNFETVFRIINIGTKFTDDELLLFLTIRINLELLSNFLKSHFNLDIINQKKLQEIDEELIRVGKYKQNKKNFNIALSQIRKNWGIGIQAFNFDIYNF